MAEEGSTPRELDTPTEPSNAASPYPFAFFSAYDHTVDSKGRIIIPTGFRKDLGETFAIAPTRDIKAIALYPLPVFGALLQDIRSMSRRKPSVQKYVSQFFMLSTPNAQIDAQGRLLLPPALRERFLKEAKEIRISGNDDHIRIVSREESLAEDAWFTEHLADVLAEIGDLT